MPEKRYWLFKSEPNAYSFTDLMNEPDGWAEWDGVRNYQARNNMKAMKEGDRLLWYHSVKAKEVVGIVEVAREHYQDPTTDDERWVVVDVRPVAELARPVTLKEIKGQPDLQEIPLIRQSRLSVMPLPKKAFDRIVALGGGATPIA